MSRIATALAVSRGADPEQSVSELTPAVAPAEATPPAAPRFSRRLLLIAVSGGLAAFLLAGLLLWLLLRAEEPAGEDWVRRTTRRIAPKAVAPAPASQPEPAAPAAAELPAEPVPSEEIARVVQELSITAVASGSAPRAYIAGKVYYVGDEIAPGLRLAEIADGVLVFRDAAGAAYPRRF